MTYRDTALKRDALMQALPARPEDAIATAQLEASLGFSVRAHLDSLYANRLIYRRQDEAAPRGRWLWWRISG